jgi:uncharacterized protein YjiS (DUF1127 family)
MTIIDELFFLTTTQGTRRRSSLFARAGLLVNRVVATFLAHRQRQAELVLLRRLGDRELKDIGLYRSEVEYSLDEAARARSRKQLEIATTGHLTGSNNTDA